MKMGGVGCEFGCLEEGGVIGPLNRYSMQTDPGKSGVEVSSRRLAKGNPGFSACLTGSYLRCFCVMLGDGNRPFAPRAFPPPSMPSISPVSYNGPGFVSRNDDEGEC